MAVKKKTKTNEVRITTADFTQAVTVQNPRNLYNIYSQEFSGLKPDMIHSYLDFSRKGVNLYKSLLFEEIRRRDLRIGGVCQTRKMAVANKEYEVGFKSDSALGESLRKEIVKNIHDNFDRIEIVNFFTDCGEAQLQGVSTFEADYIALNNKIMVDKLRYIPNHLLLYDDIADEYKYLDHTKCDARAIRGLAYNGQDRIDLTGLTVEGIHPYKIIEVHSLDGNAQNGFMNGCIDSLIWAFLFKNYGLKDWSMYVERFASPILVAKYPPFMGQPDKASLQKAVENYGNLFKLMIPDTASFDTLGDKDKSGSGRLFTEYIEYWNTEVAIRVLGQSLSTGTGGSKGGGSYALGKVHNAVREDLVVADMLLVKRAVNTLIRRLVEMNYGNLGEFPVFSFKQEKDIEFKKQRSEIFKNLFATGWKVSKENIEEEFDVEVNESTTAPLPDPGQSGGDQQQYVQKFIEEYFDFSKGE